MKTALRAAVTAMAWLGLQAASADLVLSAPPRETPEAGQKIYGPLADYLSQATGEKVVYRYPDNWGVYQALMSKGEYDLVFDGPHFVSWRIAHQRHVPLAALDGRLEFVVIARAGDAHVHALADLVGKPVCGHAPPNLATLTLFDQFANPARQPRLIETQGFDKAYHGLISGKCAATVLPLESYRKLETDSGRTRVLLQSRAYPNQALTAGPRVSEPVRARIVQALLSEQGRASADRIAASLGGRGFVAVEASDYQDLGGLLRSFWGFDTSP